MSADPTILVIEGDDHLAGILVDHLHTIAAAHIIRTASAADTLALDLDVFPDVILAELQLADGDGLDVIRTIRHEPQCPVLLMTATPTLHRALEALRFGVTDLLVKPFDLDQLSAAMRQALNARQEHTRHQRRCRRLEQLVRKVLDDRRQLQQRVELVCRDLVGAYRDLAERLVREQRLGS